MESVSSSQYGICPLQVKDSHYLHPERDRDQAWPLGAWHLLLVQCLFFLLVAQERSEAQPGSRCLWFRLELMRFLSDTPWLPTILPAETRPGVWATLDRFSLLREKTVRVTRDVVWLLLARISIVYWFVYGCRCDWRSTFTRPVFPQIQIIYYIFQTDKR